MYQRMYFRAHKPLELAHEFGNLTDNFEYFHHHHLLRVISILDHDFLKEAFS